MKFYIVLFFTILFSLSNPSVCETDSRSISPFDFDKTELSSNIVELIKVDNLNEFQKVSQNLDLPKNLYPSTLTELQKFLMCKLLICAIESEALLILNFLIKCGGECCMDDARVQKTLEEHKPFNHFG